MAKGKPISLGEVGEIPTAEILRQQPQWTWYMPWAWILFVANTPESIGELMQSDRVLTLDVISFTEPGSYSVLAETEKLNH